MIQFWNLERHLDQVALIDAKGNTVSYRKLAVLADEMVQDVEPASIFAIECTNNVATVVAYLGALRKMAVPLMVDANLDRELREMLYGNFRISRIFDAATASWSTRNHCDVAAPVKAHADLGLLLSTSGSTGSSKLVRLSRENLAENAESIVEYLNIRAADIAITSLPLHYSYGLSVLNSHLSVGARIVVTEAAVTTAGFWEVFRREKVSNLAGVPTTWRILRRMRFERMDLPSLMTITQAGGRLEPDEIEWLAAISQPIGRRVFIMYGQTEATARISYVPSENVRTKAGSIGIAIPKGELRLVDGQNNTVQDNIEGQLVYKGPNVMLGYAVTPQDLSLGRTIEELYTGDLAMRDGDGYYWVTGRLNRFIKLFGNRFSLEEVESNLIRYGHEAGVVGRDDLLMVGLVGSDEDAVKLKVELSSRYKVHASAIAVVPVAALPRNSAGKLLYGELLEQITACITKASHHAQ